MQHPDGSPASSELGFSKNLLQPASPVFPRRPHLSGYVTQKRSAPRKVSRPSTAPAGEESSLLPSLPPPEPYESASSASLPESELPTQSAHPESKQVDGAYMQTVLEDDADGRSNTFALVASTDVVLQANETTTPTISSDKFYNSRNLDYDWATFITAYAAGRWDPHRTPNPPVSYQFISSSRSADLSRSSDQDAITKETLQFKSDPQISAHKTNFTSKSDERLPLTPDIGASLAVPSTSPSKPRLSIPLHIPLPSHRFRGSFSSSLPITQFTDESAPQSSVPSADVHATVATMRWAAARVDISPLALPSPEHELTDPMRGVTAAIPGSHFKESFLNNDHPMTPGGTRRSRLSGFWEGTTDILEAGTTHSVGPTKLSPIYGSPPEPDSKLINQHLLDDEISRPIPPATAPVIRGNRENNKSPVVSADYFGDARPTAEPEAPPKSPVSAPVATIAAVTLRDDGPVSEVGTLSVPALPRRVYLTRQTSSPLPAPASGGSQDNRYFGGRVPSDSLPSYIMGRAAKEEQMFAELGYLAPPNPPDELERRRALYKFNIWHTGPDTNFDRIAHLAKLVFNTKGVVISLIDGNEQWFKSEWGLKSPSCARAASFCAHTILQRGDEPMVVLDTHRDWRFARNPFTTGTPNIRFYAGAPLRTQDGFSIGALSVIDDQPRDEFSPRQRHTLKEFAAIVVREMELWRDKIQLRIRDRIQTSMEQFSRECLEIDSEVHEHDRPDLVVGSSMDRVYDRAAKLVKRTLDVEGVIVMDVSHCEVLESMNGESSVLVTMHHGEPGMEMTKRQLTTEEYHRLTSFFNKYPDGRVSEGISPRSFKPFLPTHVQYALTVPIFNIDKRPFALLCAYNANEHPKRFLEGHELSYLRAIGVIILSAVLKRRMILADKAKGLFISNISHELRTPLHGILAAAELLSDSSLNHSQASFLQTVQACGTSLVETVNHVLDFTKLSGNSKSGGVENVIVPTTVDLMQLVEEAVDGCWIGHRARNAIMGDSGIGSVYSPPKEDQGSPVATRGRKHVETIVDIGYRSEGWTVKCEKGGMRRVLMNLFGNSLKFTTDGYVHVVLRQLPQLEDDQPDKIKVELAVSDTGKGISQNFLKNQLFHPFSQENPLQTGTGLGLAIVSSIVTSENVGGKVDVWSEEGVGTEIKVIFPVERTQISEGQLRDDESELPTVSLVGFGAAHKGVELLTNTIRTYLETWWGFQVVEDVGEITILNEDLTPVITATERRDTTRPFIILSAARGSPTIMSIVSEHERIGGFCRIVYKPGGPSRLRSVLNLSIHALVIGRSRGSSPQGLMNGDLHALVEDKPGFGTNNRRNSEETHTRRAYQRPSMTPRSSTAHPAPAVWHLPSAPEAIEVPDLDTPVPTITVGDGGTLLKASVGSLDPERRFRVLVVEDNSILRNLLIKWLSQKGYDFRAAVDGRDGVATFEKEGPFDVVLLDLSMPILDGVGATLEIRQIEADKQKSDEVTRSRILALTGMSSLEDKRRAFEAGVDGYLVKPVAFKTLDDMFHKLGVS